MLLSTKLPCLSHSARNISPWTIQSSNCSGRNSYIREMIICEIELCEAGPAKRSLCAETTLPQREARRLWRQLLFLWLFPPHSFIRPGESVFSLRPEDGGDGHTLCMARYSIIRKGAARIRRRVISYSALTARRALSSACVRECG